MSEEPRTKEALFRLKVILLVAGLSAVSFIVYIKVFYSGEPNELGPSIPPAPAYEGSQEQREAMMAVEAYLKTIVQRPDTLRCTFDPVGNIGNYNKVKLVYTCKNELGDDLSVDGEFYVKGGKVCFPPLPVTEATP